MPPSTQRNSSRFVFLIGAAILLTGALCTAGWFYRQSRIAAALPQRAGSTNSPARAVVRLRLDTQPDPPHPAPTSSPVSDAESTPRSPRFEISLDPMADFHQDLAKVLLHELSPILPDLSKFLGSQNWNSADPQYQRAAFDLIDAADHDTSDKRPALLLAADILAKEIICPTENKSECDRIRGEFDRRKLTLQYSELGGGFYYQRDLLWKVWQQYSATDWGERAFVLLLDQGWDTSTICAKGSEQFREVIRQGTSFLEEHPASPYRPVVTSMVAQAYATWWSLANETTTSPMADYVDPKLYREGSEPARLKAMGYFEEVARLDPDTKFGEYARQILPALGQRQVQTNYRFFCVYD